MINIAQVKDEGDREVERTRPRRKYDAVQSRRDILESAEKHFADKGFYGARVQAIADDAQINKRMIYEYYTNKDMLYEAVLETVYQRMADAEQAVIDQQYKGIQLIEAIVTMYFDFLEANPSFVAILLWENLNKARHIKHLTRAISRPTSQVLERELIVGQASGVFRENLDVKQTVISLITITFANFSNRYTLSQLFGIDLSTAAAMETRKRHTIEMILTYICVEPPVSIEGE